MNLTRKLHLSSWRYFLEQVERGGSPRRAWQSHEAEETEIKFRKSEAAGICEAEQRLQRLLCRKRAPETRIE